MSDLGNMEVRKWRDGHRSVYVSGRSPLTVRHDRCLMPG